MLGVVGEGVEKRCVRMRRGMRRELVEKEEMEKEEGEEGKEEDEEEKGDEKRVGGEGEREEWRDRKK